VRTPGSDLIDGNIWNLKGKVSLQLILLGSGSVTELGMSPINGFGELMSIVRQAQLIEGRDENVQTFLCGDASSDSTLNIYT
jgi:hypothetical protein